MLYDLSVGRGGEAIVLDGYEMVRRIRRLVISSPPSPPLPSHCLRNITGVAEAVILILLINKILLRKLPP